MKTEFKTMYDRFFDYEIGLELPNVLDDRINEINVSYFQYYVYFTSHIRILIWKLFERLLIYKIHVRFIYLNWSFSVKLP